MTDKERISELERNVERLEEAVVQLAKIAYRDPRGAVWLPQFGAVRGVFFRVDVRRLSRAAR